MIQEKEYLKPKLDVIEFEEDVILTSGCDEVGCSVDVPENMLNVTCSQNG